MRLGTCACMCLGMCASMFVCTSACMHFRACARVSAKFLAKFVSHIRICSLKKKLWTDRQADKWIAGQMDGSTNRRTDGLTEAEIS